MTMATPVYDTNLTKKYERRCPNWLATFEAYTIPRSEVAIPLIRWAGVWTIAAALRRRVFIPKSILGSWTCYPYLYVMFVAPPGYRKSVTINYATELLDHITNLPKPPTFTTKEALFDMILKSPDHSIYLTMEEFGDLILKGGLEMFEFLTSMFDGKKSVSQNTMARHLEHADKPSINLLAGTVPEWIAGNIPRALIGGGFASRVIWVYEDTLRQRRLFHKTEHIQNSLELEPYLIADLKHISELSGEFAIDEEAQLFLESWYQALEQNYKGFKYPGYINRKHVMALKLAQVMRIAYTDDLTITKPDAENAIRLLESVESKLDKVFQGVGKNEYALDMRDIVHYVSERKRVSDKELRRHFESIAAPSKLDELIVGVLITGKIKTIMVEGDKYYEPGDS